MRLEVLADLILRRLHEAKTDLVAKNLRGESIASILDGPSADFAVLDASPLDVDPMAIKDITVKGVVSGGRVFMN